jgi:NAD(P)-dependent dehydrogenase (short-subunit alcohol dehydrogenase family)
MNPAPSSSPVVLVTGASRRLGREIALALAASGWQVAVHYRASEAEAMVTVADCAKLAGASAAFQADLCDEAAVRALLPAVASRMGRVDAVVNNASTFEEDNAASFGFAALDKHLHSNTGAAVLLAQALHAHIAARGDENGEGAQGAVVNLLDQKLWNQNPDFFSYTLSKAALEAAGTMLALALAPLVRVVGVAPGLTLTSHLLSDAQFEARTSCRRLAVLPRRRTSRPRSSSRWKTAPSPAPPCWWTAAST